MRRISLHRRFVAAALFVSLGFILSPITVLADTASAQNITVSPATTELAANPGASTTGTMSVINEGASSYNVALSVAPYHVKGDNYDPRFTQLPGTVDAAAWVHLDTPAKQSLQARKLLNISYSLNVPAGTQPGGYYAVIFAETSPTVASTNGVVAHDRVGNILYITVNGAIKPVAH